MAGANQANSGVAQPFGFGRQHKVAQSCTVAPQKEGVHDRQRAAHPEGKVQKKPDDGTRVEGHLNEDGTSLRWSLGLRGVQVAGEHTQWWVRRRCLGGWTTLYR